MKKIQTQYYFLSAPFKFSLSIHWKQLISVLHKIILLILPNSFLCASHLDVYFCPRCLIRYFFQPFITLGVEVQFFWILWILFSCLSPLEGLRLRQLDSLRPHNPHPPRKQFLALGIVWNLNGCCTFRRKTSALNYLMRSVLASPHLCCLQWS